MFRANSEDRGIQMLRLGDPAELGWSYRAAHIAGQSATMTCSPETTKSSVTTLPSSSAVHLQAAQAFG